MGGVCEVLEVVRDLGCDLECPVDEGSRGGEGGRRMEGTEFGRGDGGAQEDSDSGRRGIPEH